MLGLSSCSVQCIRIAAKDVQYGLQFQADRFSLNFVLSSWSFRPQAFVGAVAGTY